MGRLKVHFLSSNEMYEPFQFHYGTIKRSTPCGNKVGNSYFNSTMGRLKEDVQPYAACLF